MLLLAVFFFFLGRALNALKNSLEYTIPFRKSTGAIYEKVYFVYLQ